MSISKNLSFGERLRHERLKQKWTQEELAQKLNTTKLSIIRWENGQSQPHFIMERQLYEIFGKTAETFGVFVPIWNVPFERNPYFLGREQTLSSLHNALIGHGEVALTQHALSGLGGIGKTQTAVEYAYRYAYMYDVILWVRADSHKLLASEFASLAILLNLQKREEEDQQRSINAVKHWLQTHSRWLMIFDNVEDIDMISSFLPRRREGSSVLLTTRVQVRGKYVKKIDIEKLSHEESILFLLRRAKHLEKEGELGEVSKEEGQAAEQLCRLLDGLPLALEQAAAFIEENQKNVVDYLHLYMQHPATLLQQRSTVNADDYPHSVATTWLLSFKQIEQRNPAAASLLRLCAFLHPDAIPEEMIVAGATHLDSHLLPLVNNPSVLDAAFRALATYSLVHRKAKTLTLHRLVQVVIKDGMSQETYRQWTERTIRMVNAAFPDGEFATWSDCERYLPHAQACATLIEQENMFIPEAAYLLNRMGYYLTKRARYAEAVSLLTCALPISEQQLGSQHLDTAEILNNLATAYRELCKHEEAEPLYQRALAIREQQLGLRHPDTARTLHDLAHLFWQQERFEETESLAQRALAIREQILGEYHPETAQSLDDLGTFYYSWGKYAEAEPLVQRALRIREQVLGLHHPDTGESLNDLALLYFKQKRYADALGLYTRALKIFEQQLGPQHRYTATVMNNLAQIHKEQGHYGEAESLWQRVRAIREQVLGPQHPDMANVLLYLAMIYNIQSRYMEAEPLLQEALAIREQYLEPMHPDIGVILFNFAILYQGQHRYMEAEDALRRTLTIRQQHLGLEHADTLHCLHSLALLYSLQGRYDQAESLYSKA